MLQSKIVFLETLKFKKFNYENTLNVNVGISKIQLDVDNVLWYLKIFLYEYK